jgi:hypothetical protein
MMRQSGWVGLLVVAQCASAGPQYLPAVGPPALRFQTPAPPPPANPVALPPLVVVEPRPTPLADPPPPAESTNAVAEPILFDPFAVPQVSEPIVVPATNVTFAVQAEPETLVPQMFMRYFIGGTGTNAAGVSIFSPVGFEPPLPIVPPSSSATFQTVPAGKP